MKKISVLLTAFVLMLTLALMPVLAQTARAEAAETQSGLTIEILPKEDAATVEDAAAIEEGDAETEEEEPYTGIMSASSLIAIAVVLAAMVAALMISKKRVKWNASMIAKAAVCVALSYILSMIKLFRMPMGGSVTLVSSLPLILFAVAYGPLEGLLVGFAYGLMQLLIDPYVIHPIQLLVDYPMAYGAIALACLGTALPVNNRLKLPLAMVFGYLGRYLMSVLSGVVFFAEYAGEQGALIYSLSYNISYLWPEILACVAIALLPGVQRLPKLIRNGR